MDVLRKSIPYHNLDKIDYVSGMIADRASLGKHIRVLDMGCGTGELFTLPLADKLKEFKNVQITGMDIHSESVERASRNADNFRLDNVRFTAEEPDDNYDFVCLIVVLEHVEDYASLLVKAGEKLNSGGILLLNIPNGLGAYELEYRLKEKIEGNRTAKKVFDSVLKFMALLIKPFRRGKRENGGDGDRFDITETLNTENNVHINFFRYRDIMSKLGDLGYEVVNVRKHRFLGSYYSDHYIFNRFRTLENVNAWIASRLPAGLSSEWTFVLVKSAKLGEKEYFDTLYMRQKEAWLISKRSSQSARFRNYMDILKRNKDRYESVLDIGCSQGQFTSVLSGICGRVSGLDFSETAVKRAEEKFGIPGRVDFVTGDALDRNSLAGSYDLVVAVAVLHYYSRDNQEIFLENVKGVLKPGGYLLISGNLTGDTNIAGKSEFIDVVSKYFSLVETADFHGRLYGRTEKFIMKFYHPLLQIPINFYLSLGFMERLLRFLSEKMLGDRGISEVVILAKNDK